MPIYIHKQAVQCDIPLVSVRSRYQCFLKRLAIVADIQSSYVIVSALGKYIRPHQQEPIVVPQVSVKLCHFSEWIG